MRQKQLAFKANLVKISQEYGSLKGLAKAFNMNANTLDQIIYYKKSLSFRSDKNRKIVNELVAQGYLSYNDKYIDKEA